MLVDVIWVVYDKIRCYAKEVLSLNVPPKYVNLCGLPTARCVQVIITYEHVYAVMEVVSNEEMEDV